jgi:hypothetical protein
MPLRPGLHRREGEQHEEADADPEECEAAYLARDVIPPLVTPLAYLDPLYLPVEPRPLRDLAPQLHEVDGGMCRPLADGGGSVGNRGGNVVALLANFGRTDTFLDRQEIVRVPPLAEALAHGGTAVARSARQLADVRWCGKRVGNKIYLSH